MCYPQIAQAARDYCLMLNFVAAGRGMSILPAVLSVIWRQDKTRPVMTALLRAIAQIGIRQTTNLG